MAKLLRLLGDRLGRLARRFFFSKGMRIRVRRRQSVWVVSVTGVISGRRLGRAELERVAAHMREHGWALVDADTVLIMQQPKIAPYRDEMRATMASALGVDAECVGVKATTTEGLGAIGRMEGAGAQAVVLLERA